MPDSLLLEAPALPSLFSDQTEVIPAEVSTALSLLDEQSRRVLDGAFSCYLDLTREWSERAHSIIVTDEGQFREISQAKALRLQIKKARCSVESARKELGEASLRRTQAINAVAKMFRDRLTPLEEHLEKQENFPAIKRAERMEARRVHRFESLSKYDPNAGRHNLLDMEDSDFEKLLAEAQSAHAAELARIEAERVAREEKERKDREERARIEAENARLKAEAEAKAKADAEAEDRRKARFSELSKYDTEAGRHNLRDMQEEEFLVVLAAAKEAHAIAAAKAEVERAEREAKERADREERDRVARENARLKAEADAARAAKEKADAEAEARRKARFSELSKYDADAGRHNLRDMQEEEFVAVLATAKSLHEAAVAKAESERIAREAKEKAEREERDRIEAENARLKAEAEAKAEAERVRLAEEAEARRQAALAPDREKLLAFAQTVRSLELPSFTSPEGSALQPTLQSQVAKFADWIDARAKSL